MLDEERMVKTKGVLFTGFVCGFAIFAIANMVSYPMSRSFRISPKVGLLDDGHAFGFPFAFYFVWDGIPRESAFMFPEATLNFLISLVGSAVIALLLTKAIGRRVAR